MLNGDFHQLANCRTVCSLYSEPQSKLVWSRKCAGEKRLATTSSRSRVTCSSGSSTGATVSRDATNVLVTASACVSMLLPLSHLFHHVWLAKQLARAPRL